MSRRIYRYMLSSGLALGGTVGPSVALGQAQSSGVPAVSLGEARRRATSVNPDAVAARTRVETAGWERRAARTNLFTPSLTGGVNYTRFSEPFFNFGTGAITPNATSATLEARYTVLGAGKFGMLRSANASLESAEANETAARFLTALDVDAAYFSVLADRELGRVANERLKRAEEQFGIARVRVLAGEAIASDSLQLLLEVNRARLAVLSQDSALAASQFRLGNRIGLEGPADAAAIDSALPPPLPFSEADAIAEMRTRGPEIEAARADERRADAVLTAERERYLPAISLAATTGAYDSELFPSALRRSQLAVAVSLPFWDGGQRELAVARLGAERTVARSRR
ncbi:MAG: TolC family protein, partial [Gemmatimonadota bacterium]